MKLAGKASRSTDAAAKKAASNFANGMGDFFNKYKDSFDDVFLQKVKSLTENAQFSDLAEIMTDPNMAKGLSKVTNIPLNTMDSIMKGLKSPLDNIGKYLEEGGLTREVIGKILNGGILLFTLWVVIEIGFIGAVGDAFGSAFSELLGVAGETAKEIVTVAGDAAGFGLGAIWEVVKLPVIIGSIVCFVLIVLMMVTKSSVSQFTG